MSSLSYVFLGAALVAFALGTYALSESRDVVAMFWLAVGAICVRCAPRLAAAGSRA